MQADAMTSQPFVPTRSDEDARHRAVLRRFIEAGEREPLGDLFAEISPVAWRLARRLTGTTGDPDDAVQEGLISAMRGAHGYRGQGSVRSWLLSAVANAAKDQVRARSSRRRHEAAAGAEPPRGGPESGLVDRVRAALERLPMPERTVVELHVCDGLPHVDIAAALGASESAIRKRQQRGLERLRRILDMPEGACVVALSGLAVPDAPAYVGEHAARVASSGPQAAMPSGRAVMRWACVIAAGLVATLVWRQQGVSPVQAEAPPPPAAKADTYWSGSTREMLRCLTAADVMQKAYDLESLRALAPALKPTSLLADPRLQPLTAALRMHGGHRWNTLASTAGGMPLCELAAGRTRGYVEAQQTNSRDLRFRGNVCIQAFSTDMSDAHISDIPEIPPIRIGTMNVRMDSADSKIAAITSTSGLLYYVFAIPDPIAWTKALGNQAIPPGPLATPAWFRCDSTPFVRRLARFRPQDGLPLERWFPDWRTTPPALSISAMPRHGAWGASWRVTGVAGWLKPFSSEIAGCDDPAAPGFLALGFNPATIQRALAGWLPACLNGLLEHVDGDLAICIGAGEPLPRCDLVLGHDDQSAVAAACTGIPGAEPFDVPGAQGWRFPSAWGTVAVVVGTRRLVVSTGSDGYAHLLSSAAGRNTGLLARGRLDLPRLVRHHLASVLWRIDRAAAGRDWKGPLGILGICRQYDLWAGDGPAIDLAAPPEVAEKIRATFTDMKTKHIKPGSPGFGHFVVAQCQDPTNQKTAKEFDWLPEGDGPTQIERSFALYRVPLHPPFRRAALASVVYRLDDGWHIARDTDFGVERGRILTTLEQATDALQGMRQTSGLKLEELDAGPGSSDYLSTSDYSTARVSKGALGWVVRFDGRDGISPPLATLEQLEAALAGHTRIAGAAPADLAILRRPARLMPCSSLRPDASMVAEHIAAWSMEARQDGEVIRIEEDGLPLLGIFAASRLGDQCADQRALELDMRREADRRCSETVRKRHAERLTALTAIRRKLDASHQAIAAALEAETLAKPGDLLRLGILVDSDVAALVAGTALPTPEALDRCGRINAGEAIWRLPLEGPWRAELGLSERNEAFEEDAEAARPGHVRVTCQPPGHEDHVMIKAGADGTAPGIDEEDDLEMPASTN